MIGREFNRQAAAYIQVANKKSNVDNLELARQMGATYTINRKEENLIEQIADLIVMKEAKFIGILGMLISGFP